MKTTTDHTHPHPARQRMGARLRSWRWPESWFALTLALALAFATWWLQHFIASLPFWATVDGRQVRLSMVGVRINDYATDQWRGQSRAKSLAMESLAATPSMAEQELWRFSDWQSMVRVPKPSQDEVSLYYGSAPQAIYEKQQDRYHFSPIVQILGLSEKKPDGGNPLNAEHQLALSAYADMEMYTKQAVFESSAQIFSVPSRVDLRLKSHHLSGQSLVWQLGDNHLILAKLVGVLY